MRRGARRGTMRVMRSSRTPPAKPVSILARSARVGSVWLTSFLALHERRAPQAAADDRDLTDVHRGVGGHEGEELAEGGEHWVRFFQRLVELFGRRAFHGVDQARA